MMFDTHCHLNFSRFKNRVDEVVDRAKLAGISHIVVPGTDVETSKKALEIANNHENIYAAVGIHPHHVYEYFLEEAKRNLFLKKRRDVINHVSTKKNFVSSSLRELTVLLLNEKIVAIGEIGLDKHLYQSTKYEQYHIDENFIELQKKLFKQQIKLAIKFDKSLILHNREARSEFLQVLNEEWNERLAGRTVFHCCEPYEELLDFSLSHNIYIGVDGDITYNKQKQEFIKKIPLNRLVLETDSPFLLPEPLRTQKLFPNEPKNLKLVAEFISEILNVSIKRPARRSLDVGGLINITCENAKKLFMLKK